MGLKGGGEERNTGQAIGDIQTGPIVLLASCLDSRRAYHCHSRILVLDMVEIRELCR